MTEPEFPGTGATCNGCGLCCRSRPCGLARDFAGVREGACPVLIKRDGIFRCGLVVEPHKHMPGMANKAFADAVLGPMFAEALGIGTFCDSEA